MNGASNEKKKKKLEGGGKKRYQLGFHKGVQGDPFRETGQRTLDGGGKFPSESPSSEPTSEKERQSQGHLGDRA